MHHRYHLLHITLISMKPCAAHSIEAAASQLVEMDSPFHQRTISRTGSLNGNTLLETVLHLCYIPCCIAKKMIHRRHITLGFLFAWSINELEFFQVCSNTFQDQHNLVLHVVQRMSMLCWRLELNILPVLHVCARFIHLALHGSLS